MLRALFIGCCLLIPSAELLACKCLPPPPPKEAMKESDFVFSGTVTAIEAQEDHTVITFTVKQSFKGLDDKTEVKLIARRTSCDWRFQGNETYLVYGSQNEGKLSTHLCTRTKLLKGAEEEVKDLIAASQKN